MQIVDSIAECRLARDNLAGTIALVPTMGNLHEGHLTLVKAARQLADKVIVTIFVNPMQFGANEDLASYPRTLADDIAKLEQQGVDLLFTPTTEMMYPDGVNSHTQLSVPQLTADHCGKNRPGHFTGVATIVLKLFNITQPHVAVFGKKDYQQLTVIRKLTTDMALPTRIIGMDTIREANGLAMSSRNQYLSDAEKQQAAQLQQQLRWVKSEIVGGNKQFEELSQRATIALENAGFVMDYLAVANQVDLRPATGDAKAIVILAAGKLGATRLIDNIDFELDD